MGKVQQVLPSLRRAPTTPGEILREEFLIPLGLSQKVLADHIGYDVKVVNRLINKRSSLTVDLALRLASAFETTPEFWLNAQKACDIYIAQKKAKLLPAPILGRKTNTKRGNQARLDGKRAA